MPVAVLSYCQEKSSVSDSEKLLLEDGTPVKLKLLRDLSSTKDKPGAAVEFEVIEDVTVGAIVLIKKGAAALGTVIDARPAKRAGRAGKLDVRIDSVQLANQSKMTLRAVRKGPDGSRKGEVALAVAAAGLLFFPVAPMFLLMKGENISVPQGTLVTAFIDGEHTFTRQDFRTPDK